MAPIVSFIRISQSSVLPVRTFINRKEIQNHISSTTIETHTSTYGGKLVKNNVFLSKVSRITLSNRDLKSLHANLKPILLPMLLETPIEELISLNNNKLNKDDTDELNPVNSIGSESKLRIPLSTDTWNCFLIITLSEVENIRKVVSLESTSFLSDSSLGNSIGMVDGKRMTIYSNTLLVKDMIFGKKAKQDEDDEDDSLFVNDEDLIDTKDVRVKYRNRFVVPVHLDVHVYSKN